MRSHILEDLPKEEQAEILEQLPPPERIALARSLDYPEDSAGRRMQTEFIAVPPFWTVGQTIDYMRETADLPERFYELYVVDAGHQLLGAVALDRLLRTKRPVPIAELIDEDRAPRCRRPTTRRTWRGCSSATTSCRAPVVDESERLVGVITVDDIVDVIEEEAEEDIQRARRRRPRGRAVRLGLAHRAAGASPGCSSICSPRSWPRR